jgi:hypothetical protein
MPTLEVHQSNRIVIVSDLKIIVHKPVLERPGRCEPRERKRLSKAYPLMKQPRNQLRRQLQAV